MGKRRENDWPGLLVVLHQETGIQNRSDKIVGLLEKANDLGPIKEEREIRTYVDFGVG